MNGAFYIGATGLHSQQRALDVVANNIANMNTPAYKRGEIRFSELVQPTGVDEGLAPVAGEQAAQLAGVAADATGRSFAQGDIRATGQLLDLAISGEGFIELLGPGGETLLWRGGTLTVNAEGYLAAANGMPLKAMISVPEGAASLTISADGKVATAAAAGAAAAEIGQIEIAMLRDPGALKALDGGLFEAGAESGLISTVPGEEGGGRIVQGSIEGSNVQLSDEMVAMLLMQRAYAANAQVLQAGDQLMSIANGLKR